MEWIISRKIATYIKENLFDEIQSLLEPYSLEERKRIVSEKVKKTSLLYTAIECQNLRIVNLLLNECGANPNDTGHEMGLECPCLWKVADLNNLEVAQVLVEHGVEIDGSNCLETTALFIACRNGHFNMVRFLSINGADVNSSNHEGVTCLMASIFYSDISSHLISLGANVNQVSHRGDSALVVAIEAMKVETVTILLKAGADLTITNNRGENAIFLAGKEHLQINSEYFQPKDQLEAKSLALASEISSCHYTIIGEETLAIVSWQKALKLRNLPEQTPLYQHEITFQSELQPIKNILDSKDEEILSFLESRLGLRNMYTIDMLIWAIHKTECFKDYMSLFNFFIKVINSTDNLLFFEMYVHIDVLIMTFLLKNSFQDGVPFASSRFSDIFDGIVVHLEDLSRRLRYMNDAAKLSKSVVMELYIYLIFDIITIIERQCKDKMQPIYESVSKIVKLDFRGRRHMSLLHFCIDKGYQPHVARTLLSSGADINAMDDNGMTPVHCALTSYEYCNKKTIDLFLDHGLRFDESSEENPCLPCVLNQKNLLRQPLRYSSLQCLAAKVVAKNYDTTKIPLPRTYQIIINSHKL